MDEEADGYFMRLLPAVFRLFRDAALRGELRRGAILSALTVFTGLSTSAVSLNQLRTDPDLNPKKFARHFQDFEYELRTEVQPIHKFLARRTGDCDDYACLADEILPEKGYETRLIHIRLASLTAHAVCYVSDDGAYLDYNNRAVFKNTVRAKPTIRHIATKVARSMGANWTTASEFVYSYEYGRKLVTATVVRTASPDLDPPPIKASIPARLKAFYVD
jgi:hypothetical protein